jgi:hypothetical protein
MQVLLEVADIEVKTGLYGPPAAAGLPFCPSPSDLYTKHNVSDALPLRGVAAPEDCTPRQRVTSPHQPTAWLSKLNPRLL